MVDLCFYKLHLPLELLRHQPARIEFLTDCVGQRAKRMLNVLNLTFQLGQSARALALLGETLQVVATAMARPLAQMPTANFGLTLQFSHGVVQLKDFLSQRESAPAPILPFAEE